jgi:hypothetical protein
MAVRSSLLLADLVGVGAGAVAEGRKCWRRLLWCSAMRGEAVAEGKIGAVGRGRQ